MPDMHVIQCASISKQSQLSFVQQAVDVDVMGFFLMKNIKFLYKIVEISFRLVYC